MTALLRGDHLWVCPNCKAQDVTHEARPHTRFHACAALHGLAAPMVKAGDRVKISIREREDYVGNEIVTTVAGRPIMSVVTERSDGSNDVVVYAPAATARGEAT